MYYSSLTKSLPPDEKSGLVTKLVLANSTIIMLTMNLWPEVGLCNGASGKVIDIIYAENSYPPMVLIAVVVIETQKYWTLNLKQYPLVWVTTLNDDITPLTIFICIMKKKKNQKQYCFDIALTRY